jgi:beta-galactosidase GanA
MDPNSRLNRSVSLKEGEVRVRRPEFSHVLANEPPNPQHDPVAHGLATAVFALAIWSFAAVTGVQSQTLNAGIPHLVQRGSATQLVVNGKPMLILAGELGNSSASVPGYLDPYWKNFDEMHMNAVVIPAYWELIEPEEGRFDFSTIDSAVFAARRHDLKIVFLWFGTWKNSMSCYVPLWVKTDETRFPRARTKNGEAQEILTPFSTNNRDADARAFAAVMKHIREIDGTEHTVILVQVENEIGMIPDARDHSPLADKAFTEDVPAALLSYLEEHKDSLSPELKERWKHAGYKESGKWTEVFGQSAATEEFFMAWYLSRYTNYVAAAGKREYPLPMYVNAALIRPGYKPGQYPSAGPLPHLMDIWKTAAPDIDFLAPDIYFPPFKEWVDKFYRPDNHFFIPECQNTQGIANAYYAIAEDNVMGFSPFAIESVPDPPNNQISQGYKVLRQLAPLILENQGKGTMRGILLDSSSQETRVALGNYEFRFQHEDAWRYWQREPGPPPRVGGLIIELSPDEFIIAGTGMLVTFRPKDSEKSRAGIGFDYLGRFEDGKWVTDLVLNGDQTNQGRQFFLPGNEFSIQKVRLYTYH